mmetsp:Transcript_11246/g.39155  ORF Transcript_11246/g.39155 Transcript_11246/m.39155 type:complete len:337 (+) Transcript_11246:852-1862(+)
MIAPFGPLPAIVSKDTPWKCACSARNASSRSDTLYSSNASPADKASSSQRRKRQTATASRRWAARMPAISTSFLSDLASAMGVASRTRVAPLVDSASASAWLDVAGSIHTRFVSGRLDKKGMMSSYARMSASAARCSRSLSFVLAASTKRIAASIVTATYAIATGLHAMSLPRTLRSHATSSSADTITTSTAFFAISRRRSASLSAVAFPENSMGWGTTGDAGFGGRADAEPASSASHTISTRLGCTAASCGRGPLAPPTSALAMSAVSFAVWSMLYVNGSTPTSGAPPNSASPSSPLPSSAVSLVASHCAGEGVSGNPSFMSVHSSVSCAAAWSK